ncbi:MAG: thiamine biosynthesis protein [Deltaproteobacteria bacterium]|nr:thiamine biosynthesis protein [Deltaproteobacteria bacterium]
MNKQRHTAIALFSGGLDSILACRVVAEQGVKVKAIKFVTPFFDYDLLTTTARYQKKIRDKYDIDVEVRDITDPYLRMLHDPPHGYGKHFNPCIDCKILMISEAKKLMADYHASFIITGEVVGQRPMSQRKDTLRVIERDSGTDSLLLRPLCTQCQKPTAVELAGIIDREKLPGISGRGRAPQRELAAKFGITDYPNAAGGCVLTDKNLALRIQGYYRETTEINKEDIRFLLAGRQFRLPHGGWLAMGRDEEENNKVARLRQSGDVILRLSDRPGPTALLRHSRHGEDIRLSAALLVRYGKKIPGAPPDVGVTVTEDQTETMVYSPALPDDQVATLAAL